MVQFEVGDDLIGIEVFFFQFLVVASALECISGSNVLGHGLVELVGSKSSRNYLLFSLDLIFCLLCSINTIYLVCYKSLQTPLFGPATYFCCFLGGP